MTEQIRLPLGDDNTDWKALLRRHWPTLLESIRHACDRIGRKQVAHDLKVSTKVLDNLLADRERHSLKMKLLPYFLVKDRGVMETIAALGGYKVSRIDPPSPEEQLAALKAVLRTQGDVGRLLLERAGVEG